MDIKHAVRNPSGIKLMIGMMLIGVCFVMNLRSNSHHGVLNYVSIAGVCYSVIVLILVLYRTFKKPGELRLNDESLSINGRTIRADQIKVIKSMGDDIGRPVIGIKPYGKRIVPIRMSFRFLEDGERGLKDLANWAERNNVQIKYEFFFKWI